MENVKNNKNIPYIFILISIPIFLFFVFYTPPYQEPDEQAHLGRVDQISHGQFIGVKVTDRDSGGWIDPAFLKLHALLGSKPIDKSTLQQARAIQLSDQTVYADFGNTIPYGPVLYMPQALAVYVSRTLGLTALQSFYAARIASGIAAISLGFMALRLAKRGQLMIFYMLTIPMSLFLFASVSQDALLLSGAALFVSLASRIIISEGQPTLAENLSLAFLLTVLSCGRLPYIALGGILLTRPFAARRCGVTLYPLGAGPTMLLLCLSLVIVWNLTISYIQVNLLPDVDMARQGKLILAHPWLVPKLFLTTFWVQGLPVHGFFGVLGLLDVPLPDLFYKAAMFTFVFVAWCEASQHVMLSWNDKVLIAASIILGVSLTYLALYLTWTPVGGTIILGVQGRYLIPFAMLLPFCLPTRPIPSGRERWGWYFVSTMSTVGAIVGGLKVLAAY